ncbi:MAG: UDP-N-acetylmuramate dehydrogenase [Bacillota bacterium]
MNLDQLIRQIPGCFKGEYRLHEPMKYHTTWKIGGPADMVVFPRDIDDICCLVKLCIENNVPWYVVGIGSNLLVLDGGIRGVVIKIQETLNKCVWTQQGVEAEAGVFLPRLAKEAARRGLSGLEWSSGIPASVGGAIAMNAGVGNNNFGSLVKKVEVVDGTGKVRWIEEKDLSFGYRHSIFLEKNNWIVTKAIISLVPGDKDESKNLIKEYLSKRHSSQPVEFPSAGSVFKNPAHDFAGRLIESVGGKGLRCGDAEVSLKHANFIVNHGEASAKDVLTIVDELCKRVREKFNTQLEMEIRIIGDAQTPMGV